MTKLAKNDIYLVILFAIIFAKYSLCQDNPCDDENAIILPGSKKCLIYHNEAKHWNEASRVCEGNGGFLYMINDVDITHQSIRDCLWSVPSGHLDFWIGATSKWSPQWMWVNGSFLNPVLSCSNTTEGLSEPTFDVMDVHISVDYCVSVCRSTGAPYSVLEHRGSNPTCWCSFRVDSRFFTPCPSHTYRERESNNYWIFSSFPILGKAITLDSSEALRRTETLCGTVNVETNVVKELSSETCFTRNPYLCNLGNSTTSCTLTLDDNCVFVGEATLTWLSARSDCIKKGGDLLIIEHLLDMFEILPYIKTKRNHWVGAFNHVWHFQSDSLSVDETGDMREVSCGHMFYDNARSVWDWSDSRCDARKPFVCQADAYQSPRDSTSEVMCPWAIRTTHKPDIITPPRVTLLPGNETKLPEPLSNRTSSFPLAAIVAASVAAMIIILCAILTLGYSRHRQWLTSKLKKSGKMFSGAWVPTRFQRWSNAYNYYPDHMSDVDWDSFNTTHTGLRGDTLSVISVPSGYFRDHDGLGLKRAHTIASYGDLDGIYAKVSRRQSERSEKPVFRQSSSRAASTSGVNKTVLTELEGIMERNNAEEDHRQFVSAIHEASSPKSREYMTLTANMSFEDSVALRDAQRRPEVALVTNEVDLNFTVNHAISKGRHDSEQSTHERTLEEIELPRGTTFEIPTSPGDNYMLY